MSSIRSTARSSLNCINLWTKCVPECTENSTTCGLNRFYNASRNIWRESTSAVLLGKNQLPAFTSLTFRWPCIVINSYDKTNYYALISQNYFWNKTLHVSDSSCVHHQKFFNVHIAMVYVTQELQFPLDPAPKLSANLYDIHHCCVYSEKLLMMDRGTARNM